MIYFQFWIVVVVFFIVLFLVFLFLKKVHYKYHGNNHWSLPNEVIGIMTWKGCEENHGKTKGTWMFSLRQVAMKHSSTKKWWLFYNNYLTPNLSGM